MGIEKNTRREWIYRNFINQPDEFYETFSFGELKVGDLFIGLPLPGDNDGHGGFRNGCYLFKKIKDEYRTDKQTLVENAEVENAEKVHTKVRSHFPMEMPVIQVILE